MKKLFLALACLALCAAVSLAQKGKAESDYYPRGYAGDTWTGEVTAFDNEKRTLTLTHDKAKNASTFVASIPDAPYEWTRDLRKARVLDFPYDKQTKAQTFQYVGPNDVASILPESDRSPNGTGVWSRPNPPDSNRITDFADFTGRRVTVYYTPRERKVGSGSEKYNDVWRVRVIPAKKN